MNYDDIFPQGLSSLDLYDHYRNGSGRSLTLSEVGVKDKIQQLVKTANTLGKRNGHSLQGDFIEQILQGKKSFQNTYPLTPWWQFSNDPLWAMGGVTISGTFSGGVIQENEQYYLNGNIAYQLYDRFTDPYDTPNLIAGEWNPDGEAFTINGAWQERVKIPITQEQFQQFK